MKKWSLFILIFMCLLLPCNANDSTTSPERKIFIYHIPEDNIENDSANLIKREIHDIISDDITEDTTPVEEIFTGNTAEDNNTEHTNTEETEDSYPNVLKGYAIYEVTQEETITLDDSTNEILAIKIMRPYNYKGGKYTGSKKSSLPLNYSKFSNMEYSIAPLSSSHAKKIGGFTTGTMFNQMIDTAELEQSTGIFSRYDTKYFAIYTAYSKTLNSTNSNYNDNVYISPEFKLNQYFTLKEILSADMTKNRKKAEFVISINPFGKKDTDRLRIEFGANATYDDNNSLLKNQFKFSTKYQW